MNAAPEIPPWLEPDQQSDHFATPRLLAISELVDAFAGEFHIDYELALATLLAGAAHALGGAVRIDTTLGSVEPPFSLLVVTPERDPVWARIPVRFLIDEFGPAMRAFARTAEIAEKSNAGTGTRDGTGGKDAKPDQGEVARKMYADRVSERITTGSLVPPYPRLPFDHHVLLVNPPNGLVRAFRQLEVGDRFRLESALSSDRPLPVAAGAPPAAVPSFYWTIPRHDASKLLGENPWLAGLPFLMLESDAPGGVTLDPNRGCVGAIFRQHFDLFVQRHNAMGAGRCYSAGARCFDPVREFLGQAQAWEAGADRKSKISARAVAQLALRLTLLFTVLDGKTEPDHIAADCGLTVARQLFGRHCRTLATYAPAPALAKPTPAPTPDMSGLDNRERAVFLRICERPGITGPELSRSFTWLRKDERDRILVELVGRNLVRLEKGGLWQGLAA